MKITFNLKKELAIFFAILIAISAAIYLLLNAGAYFSIFRYNDNGSIFDLKISSAKQTAKNGENYYLHIPKIGVTAPIVFPKDESDKSVLDSLEEGVGIYPGSQLPGEIGRSVILGHSSRADWYKGKFAYIFALLGKLEKGDEFYIVSENKKLVYKVFAKDILTPDKTDELLSKVPENESEVALITCWPIGSSSLRTVVFAKFDREEKL
ncbi:sortase [Candidatus Azambacteria bacterium]|nr:sortase [Candidatus Azambacteria bacterium]